MATKTPISMLQELMVSKKESIPEYTFESNKNPLNPEFCCTVTLSSCTVTGTGRNKKEAKQNAAANALLKVQNLGANNASTRNSGQWKSIPDSHNEVKPVLPVSSEDLQKKNYVKGYNYVGQLNEYSAIRRLMTVNYENTVIIDNGQFQVTCSVDNLKTHGYGYNKKEAKQVAAFEMLELLKNTKSAPKSISRTVSEEEIPDLVDCKAIQKFNDLSTTRSICRREFVDLDQPSAIVKDDNDIDRVKKGLQDLNLSYETVILQESPCIVAAQITDRQITTMASGRNVKEATRDALNQAISALATDSVTSGTIDSR